MAGSGQGMTPDFEAKVQQSVYAHQDAEVQRVIHSQGNKRSLDETNVPAALSDRSVDPQGIKVRYSQLRCDAARRPMSEAQGPHSSHGARTLIRVRAG